MCVCMFDLSIGLFIPLYVFYIFLSVRAFISDQRRLHARSFLTGGPGSRSAALSHPAPKALWISADPL